MHNDINEQENTLLVSLSPQRGPVVGEQKRLRGWSNKQFVLK
jgi:hypothetical protein